MRTLASLAAFALVGCGEGEPRSDRASEAAGPAAPEAASRARPRLYDAEGRLLPSDAKVAGLTLPRGLEPLHEDRTDHVYVTEVPTAKVLEYFGPRLFTAHVERVGGGAVYRGATPVETRGSAIHLDVSILPASGGRTRVRVHELPQPPAERPSEDALRRAREQGFSTLD